MAELYLAGYDMVPIDIIDNFESLIWTERFQSFGDFVLTVKERPSFLEDLRKYKYLRLSDSYRVMMIETVKTGTQVDGVNVVTIEGRSFEYFLTMRSNQTLDPNEISITMKAGEAARYFVERYCMNAETTDRANVIPYLTAPHYESDKEGDVTVVAERGTIYKIVQDICQGAGLGFRIDKEPSGDLVFRAYRGQDRTDPASATYLEYSSDAENFGSISSTESIANYYNHVRMVGAQDIVDVFAPGTPDTVAGLERRTIVAEARDIGDEDDTSQKDQQLAALHQRGLWVLADANNRYNRLIDGEVSRDAWAERIFNLGDLVVVKDNYDLATIMLISEQIYSIDNAGLETLIPTFQEIAGI
jgi:hypothetical protein